MVLNCRAPAAEWPAPHTDYEAAALAFCRLWQSGQKEFILHTSGSTGAPKPITLTRLQMMASAHLTGQTFRLCSGDHALVCLNSRYIAGIMMLVRGMELGLTLTLVAPTSNPVAEFRATTQFDFAAFVPLQLQTLLEQTPDKLPILNGMKAILIGGAATNPALEQALQLIKAPVWATYGMTETVSHIAIRRLNGNTATDYFTALAGVSVGVDDRSCLHITAPATNEQLVQTNDVVEFVGQTEDKRQRFRLLGRADRIINSGGVKVQPELVETLIERELTRLRQAVPRLFVVGLPDERLGQRIVLFMEAVRDITQWPTILETIRQEIGPYAVPKAVISVAQFAETATGKLDRNYTVNSYLRRSA